MSKPEDEQTPSGKDRRKAVRYACILEAAWQEGERVRYRPGWPARVLNISTDGIALHSGEHFAPGTLLTISLQGETVTQTRVKVRIVHSSPQPNDTWVLGGAFVAPLKDGDLENLLG